MEEKDRKLVGRSALTIADEITSINPWLHVAWGLTKSLFGRGLELRQERALEFVELIKDNRGVFTDKVLSTQEFQDGFIFALERYIRERSELKRRITGNIFLGFSGHYQDTKFELEKLVSVLDRLSIEDIEVLSIWANGKIESWYKKENYNIHGTKTEAELVKMKLTEQLNVHQLTWIISGARGGDESEQATYESLAYLASIGLLVQPSNYAGGVTDNFRLSRFGEKFIEYLHV